MRHRLSLWALVVILIAALAPAGPAHAKGGDEPIIQPFSHSGNGETTRSIDQAGIEVYGVHDGHDLDHYLYRSSSPLDFAIELDRDYGAVDAAGNPAPGNALFGRTARLTLRARDVDESYPGTDVEPEVDLIRVNGVQIDGQLSGADEQWSISTFVVPASLLRLPTVANPTGRNNFEVLIDTANQGADAWAVEIDWAELRPIVDSGPRPAILVHGFDSAHVDGDPPRNDMSPFRDFLELNHPALEGRVSNPLLDGVGSISGRSALLQGPLEEVLVNTGAASVNIVGHSYGGLVARRYAWDHRDEVNSVAMVATPNGGVAGADFACAVMGLIFCNPDDALWQSQTDYVRNTFNRVVLDHDGIEYIALASVDEEITPDIEPDDGVVTVESVEWLSATNPDHPGKHRTRPHYNLEHGQLIDEGIGDPVFEDVMCEPSFYPEAIACPDLVSPMSSVATVTSPAAANRLARVDVASNDVATIPITFEGAAWGRIKVIAPNGAALSATFAGQQLTAGPFLGMDSWTATMASPSDASLTITNAGPAAVSVAVVVEIETTRTVSTALPSLVALNQPVSVSASLIGYQAGDDIDMTVRDEAGNPVYTAQLVDQGTGQFTGQIPALPAGTYSVDSQASAPVRYDRSLFTVASGAVSFAGGITEELVGTGNGLADALVIRPSINVTAAGEYAVSARLIDGSGNVVASAGADVQLDVGLQSPALHFDGHAIHRSATNGPYRVVDAVIASSDPLELEAEASDLGATASYNYGQFEHFPVRFNLAGFDDVAVDADGDGIYDELRVTGEVSVDSAGSYAINAQLRAPDSSQVAEFQTTATLSAGSNTFTLVFDGDAIAVAGMDGPYTVADLSAYPTAAVDHVGYLVTAHITAPYTVAEFGGSSSQLGTEWITTTSDGYPADGASGDPSISADGRYVAFESDAVNLPPGDSSWTDIFVYDRVLAAMSTVSVGSGGLANGSSFEPSVSNNGRRIAFESYASNLVSGDTNSQGDVFVRDLDTGLTRRVSVASNGTQADSEFHAQYPAISGDGRYVAFRSNARTLVTNDTNGQADVFVNDTVTGVTTRVSVASNGSQGNASVAPGSIGISQDGRYVTFATSASNLVSGDTNGQVDVFVHDRLSATTERVSVASTGTQAKSGSLNPTISADGRYVAFDSSATNLVVGDKNNARDVFVHDRQSHTTSRVSVASGGAQSTNQSTSRMASLSADGRFVVFNSDASNLVASDTNSLEDVFMHNRDTGVTSRISVTDAAGQGNGASTAGALSSNGRYAAFASEASNLVAGDTNALSDIFVRGDLSISP